jgi:CubicO group peptidase (beta-lactamase class C family)
MSGLPRQPFTLQTLAYFVQYLFTGENFYRHLDRDNLLNYLADFSASSPQLPQYSNIGYGLLGYALECRTGKTIDSLLSEQITGPLGLLHTGYNPEVLPGFSERARGHAGDQPKIISRGQPVPDWNFTDIMRGSGAVYSTARDLLDFAIAHQRRDGSSLSAALVDTLSVRYPRQSKAASIAWITDEVAGMHITYQVGIVAGYSSYIGLNTENGTAVVVLQNTFNWDYSVGHKLMVMLAGTSS